jgi:hypothetical protein
MLISLLKCPVVALFMSFSYVIDLFLMRTKISYHMPTNSPNRSTHKEGIWYDIFVLIKNKSITYEKDINNATTGHFKREISMIVLFSADLNRYVSCRFRINGLRKLKIITIFYHGTIGLNYHISDKKGKVYIKRYLWNLYIISWIRCLFGPSICHLRISVPFVRICNMVPCIHMLCNSIF